MSVILQLLLKLSSKNLKNVFLDPNLGKDKLSTCESDFISESKTLQLNGRKILFCPRHICCICYVRNVDRGLHGDVVRIYTSIIVIVVALCGSCMFSIIRLKIDLRSKI